MWMQHVDTRPFGCLARYPVALALAAALSAGQRATPGLARQNRPGGAQGASWPRHPVSGGGPGGLAFGNISAVAAPALLPNAETWLDFTDLVFIDPVLTGYSHIVANSENMRRQLLSVDGDADALAVVIRKWVERNGRQGAVKFIVGESYGGFRVPRVARALAGQQGVGVRGVLIIPAVLGFGNLV